MTNEEVKLRLECIFNKYKKSNSLLLREIIDRGWVFCEIQREKELLFVGINPSYISSSLPEYYSYKVQDAVKGYARHYKVFETMANAVGKTWTYMDLFYFREKKQNKINELLHDETGDGLKFICEQLQLSYELINEMSPKIIVVCNKRIYDFFGKNRNGDKNVWMGFIFEKSDGENVQRIPGLYNGFIQTKELALNKNTMIIFSRHLSRVKKQIKDDLIKEIETIFFAD